MTEAWPILILIPLWAGKMVQHVKALTAQPDDMNSILRTYIVEG